MCNQTTTPRSVDDYETDEALADALRWMEISFDGNAVTKTESATVPVAEEGEQAKEPKLDEKLHENSDEKTTTQTKSEEGGEPRLSEMLPENSDWVLTNYDPDTTKVPSVKDEFERLRVLRSYMILDVEPEFVFEKFTAQASKEFDVPIALVSLVDLGRQWFLSNHGTIEEVAETARDVAFCAHAIMRKDQHSILEVRDATKDFRFKESALVTGPPNIRFYAGAPLVSPEGYSLGTFCVIDTKARPEGLTDEQQGRLKELAAETVQRMVDRRRQLENQGLTPRTSRRGRRRPPRTVVAC